MKVKIKKPRGSWEESILIFASAELRTLGTAVLLQLLLLQVLLPFSITQFSLTRWQTFYLHSIGIGEIHRNGRQILFQLPNTHVLYFLR